MRDLVGLAHERELGAALSDLESKFKAWRAGQINCFELNYEIHKHHNGISRDLWSKYGVHPEMLLPMLVANGVIKASEVPEELMEAIRDAVDLMEGWNGQEEDPCDSE